MIRLVLMSTVLWLAAAGVWIRDRLSEASMALVWLAQRTPGWALFLGLLLTFWAGSLLICGCWVPVGCLVN